MQLRYMGIDQYGERYTLTSKHPRKELMEKLYASHADKMYVDTKGGEVKHIGYIIRGLWITLYSVHEWAGKA